MNVANSEIRITNADSPEVEMITLVAVMIRIE